MEFLRLFTEPETYVMLATLSAMEIVLGIDNIVFISVLTSRLPQEKQHGVRRLGIGLALISRLALLFGISLILQLGDDLFHLFGKGWSGKDLILFAGGLFLLGKATHEIYENVERPEEHLPAELAPEVEQAPLRFSKNLLASVLLQVVLLDIVFSLDSVITAVGMLPPTHVPVMVLAMIIAVGVMMAFADPVGDFVTRHASIRILALAFLVLIGLMLILDAVGRHVPKAYIYFAMAFSLAIQLLNMRMESRRQRLRRGAVRATARSAAKSAARTVPAPQVAPPPARPRPQSPATAPGQGSPPKSGEAGDPPAPPSSRPS